MKKKPLAKIIYVVVIVAVLGLMFFMVTKGMEDKKKLGSKEELYQKIEAGEIYGIALYSNGDVILAAKNKTNFDSIDTTFDYYVRFSGTDDAIAEIEATANTYKESGKLKVSLKFLPKPEPSFIEQMLPYLVMLAIGGFIIFFFFRQMNSANNKAAQFGRATAKPYDGKNKVTFADVAGAEEEKEEMQELVEFLKDPKRFSDMGARVPKGVLMVGPPGTGKTLLAKAVAGEAGVPFFSITGSDFVELYVGIGASRVRDLFAQAKRLAPCIIFIDEIDAVGRHRGAGMGGGHDEREQTLNQLLVEMDGFEVNSGIIVLAATNRVDILDPALLRSGRFDRQLHVLMPDVKGREEIFKVHTRNKKLAPDVNAAEIAQLTIGFTGADIENLVNEAALLAVRSNKKQISQQDIKDSITKVILGPEKKSHKYSEYSRKLTAYHEAGHAVVAFSLEGCDDVSEISIISRAGAGGYTLTRPENERDYVGKQHLLDDICMSLGGRVAEELVLNEISSGASADIRHLTKLAHSMVTKYGMADEIGPIYLGGDDNEIFLGRDFASQKSFSDQWAARIDQAVHDIINAQLERTRAILKENLELLHRVADALLEREKISGEEFLALTRGEELPPIVEDKQESAPEGAECEEASRDVQNEAPAQEPDAKDEDNKENGSDKYSINDQPPQFF